MFNLLSNMNPEKLLTAFLTGMPLKTKEEWLRKMEDARQQAAQTSADFTHIKEVVDILVNRLAETNTRLSVIEGMLMRPDETISEVAEIAENAETAATEAAIAADTAGQVLEEVSNDN